MGLRAGAARGQRLCARLDKIAIQKISCCSAGAVTDRCSPVMCGLGKSNSANVPSSFMRLTNPYTVRL